MIGLIAHFVCVCGGTVGRPVLILIQLYISASFFPPPCQESIAGSLPGDTPESYERSRVSRYLLITISLLCWCKATFKSRPLQDLKFRLLGVRACKWEDGLHVISLNLNLNDLQAGMWCLSGDCLGCYDLSACGLAAGLCVIGQYVPKTVQQETPNNSWESHSAAPHPCLQYSHPSPRL